MAKVTINNFSGGLDEDIRSHSTNTFSDVTGFDTLTNKYTLIPYGESETEALASGAITDKQITDVIREGNGFIAMMGRNSAGTPTTVDLLIKNSGTDISATNSSVTTVGGANFYQPNTLIFDTFDSSYYYINTTGQVRKIVAGTYIASSAGSLAFTSSWSGIPVPRPLLHPTSNVLYFAYGTNGLAKITAGAYSNITLDFATNRLITSMTDYGAFVAFAVTPTYAGGQSKVLIWDQNTSRTAFSDSVDWGNGSIMILENIGGTLIGVSISDAQYASSTSYTTSKVKKLTIRALSGGRAVVVKELTVDSSFNLRNFKTKFGTKLYFGGDYGSALYVVEKKEDGTVVVSKDRFINNGTAITTLRGISLIGDYLFTMFDTIGQTGNIFRTKVTSSYTNTSTFTTNINPKMDIEDRDKQKKLTKVEVITENMPAGANVSVYYDIDGSGLAQILSETRTDNKRTLATRDLSGNPFLEGIEYKFQVTSTGGAKIIGFNYEYEVIEY